MKHSYALSVLFFLCAVSVLQAQVLQGKIVNKQGAPISNSSVYIREISRGIVADDNGRFQTEIVSGTYTCEFRSLGYESQLQTVDVPASGKTIQIELTEKIYGLQEVVVYANNEDPAYRIMRRAIAYAPFYRNQIETYRSDTYTKGNFRLDKIPRIFRALSKVNNQKVDIKSLIGKTFVMESDNEITFKAPDTYTQRVKAAKSSIPKEFDMDEQVFRVVTSNIYTMNFLSPGAFRYYSFKLEDVEYSDTRVVNKIRVIPRRKNSELYSGYIYILENTWNVYAADLSSTEMGTAMRYRSTFHEVKPSVYLPTTYDMSVDINTMGVKGNGRYFVSIAYKSVTVKADKVPAAIAATMLSLPSDKQTGRQAEALPSKKEKTLKQIEKLSEKNNLSTKEAYKLSKLMQAIAESDEERKNRESLEIKEFEKVKIDVDSLAFRADSTYWEKVRVLPLHVEERKSYAISDSINPPDSMRTLRKGSRTITVGGEMGPKSVFGKVLLGGGFKINESSSLRFSGLADIIKRYSFVDGFSLGQTFTYSHGLDSNRYFSVKPSIYYVTARKTVRWQTDATWYYNPMRDGYAQLSFGHTATDLNAFHGMNSLLDGITSFVYGKNFICYFDRKFIQARNQIDIANGLNFVVSVGYESRRSLENCTSWSLFNKTPRENMPEAWQPDFPAHHAALLGFQLTYTPRYRYKIENGRKQYVSSVFPTFALRYKAGTDVSDKHAMSVFGSAAASFNQTLKTSLFSHFIYSATAGVFLNRKSLYLPDYKFFQQNPMIVTDKFFNHSFSLLPDYTYSNRYWAEAHVMYISDYLLLKNLPFLQNYLFDEALHLHFLNADNRFNHIEGGYSIGLGGLSRVGVFTAFDGKKFNSVGVRVCLPILSLF